ncbi:unnamed protein product, partial [Colias eurytheme]
IQLEIPSAPKRRGCVLTCGQGDVGQLGLGEDVIETTKFKVVSALGSKIVDACAGGMHTIALDTDGKVWTFGCNDEGALGRPTTNEQEEGTPAPVKLPAAAVKISAGDSHSAALLETGDVYAWGSFRDSHGSMGLVVRAREGKACKEPQKLTIPETAVSIASGGDHLVVLSVTGAVYTMGCGEQGQLGRLAQRSASRDARQGFSALLVPSKVTLKAVVSHIWAGYHATFALDANTDKMFAWGLNNYGQLGVTGEKRRVALYSPAECDAFPPSATAVAAGQHHSLAMDAAGKVYSVGRSEYGRLGLGDRTTDAETLEPIPKLQNKKCVSIAAGTSNSFAVTDSGEVLAWGMGSEGQLGTGSTSDAIEPTASVCVGLGNTTTPLRISAGGQHSVLFVEDKSPQKEKTPQPEEEVTPSDIEMADKPKAKKAKQEQDEHISSTSSQSEAKVDKINGDEKKETPMEVDETDKSDKSQDDNKQTDEQSAEEVSEQESKPETMDTSSQGTVDSEPDKVESVQSVDSVESVKSVSAESVKSVSAESVKSVSAEKSAEISENPELNGTEAVDTA